MTNVARLLGGALTVLAALIAVAASDLPARAQATGPAAALVVTRTDEWWLPALHMAAAWRAAPSRGKGVTVAVLSTGVDGAHPDLTGAVTASHDFSQTGRKPGSPYWGFEGTAVASLIAGHGHGQAGAYGITGVVPAAKILSVQVTVEYDDPLNSDATITRRLTAAIATGIRYAVGHGASVIALPLDPGTFGPAATGDPAAAGGSRAERAAVRYALAHGVVLVAPAGDNGAGTGAVNYPAAYRGVIAVGATARDGKLALFSNTGGYVALTAPGAGDTPLTLGTSAVRGDSPAGLLTAAPGGGYQSLASTDMAAALTAGVAALIRARYPSLTGPQVAQALDHGATAPLAPGTTPGPHATTGSPAASRSPATGTADPGATEAPGHGHGALDAAAALNAAAAIVTARQTPAAQPSPARRATSTMASHAATAGRPTAATAGGTGGVLHSFLVVVVIAASVLIAALTGLLAVARFRRRSAAQATRPARGAGGARHARGKTPAPGAQARRQLAPPPPRAALPPAALPARTPPQPQTRVLPRATRTPRDASAQQAPPPRTTGVPPWEQSPDDFADAPLPGNAPPPRPMSSTGPMYVWNPTAVTGPLRAVDEDDEE